MNDPRPVSVAPPTDARLYAIGLGCIVLIGLASRLLAARGELWLDEVWSLRLSLDAASWHELLTMTNVDNNHLLNSLWLCQPKGATGIGVRLLLEWLRTWTPQKV